MAWKRQIDPEKFVAELVHSTKGIEPGSIRWKKQGRHWIRVGCPRRKWKSRCTVPTVLLTILHPAGEKRENRCTFLGRKNPHRYRNLERAVRKFREFNWRDPRRMREVKFDLSSPLVKIGPVTQLNYLHAKEGHLTEYYHTTKPPHPVLYAHPSGKLFIILGGRLRVREWLEN